MATTLAEIRARLQQQDNRSSGNTGGMDSSIYAHWNIPEGTTASVRFLPDADPKNDFFWIERALIKLPFAGVKGQADSKPVIVQVPCVEMWNDVCPILTEVRTWFKDPALEDMGRKYWKKKSYLFQGFVRENPLKEDSTPENPIRRFVISAQIYNIIKAALMDPELVELPTDYEAGLDFRITKTTKGQYADYNTSSWARRESALTAAERAAIEKHGLYNLSDFLPKRPGEVELRVMKEMFEASVDGQPYDLERWGQYFKPNGMGGSGGSAASTAAARPAVSRPSVVEDDEPAAVAHSAPPADDDDVPVATAPVSASKPAGARAEDILQMIRNRNKQ